MLCGGGHDIGGIDARGTRFAIVVRDAVEHSGLADDTDRRGTSKLVRSERRRLQKMCVHPAKAISTTYPAQQPSTSREEESVRKCRQGESHQPPQPFWPNLFPRFSCQMLQSVVGPISAFDQRINERPVFGGRSGRGECRLMGSAVFRCRCGKRSHVVRHRLAMGRPFLTPYDIVYEA